MTTHTKASKEHWIVCHVPAEVMRQITQRCAEQECSVREFMVQALAAYGIAPTLQDCNPDLHHARDIRELATGRLAVRVARRTKARILSRAALDGHSIKGVLLSALALQGIKVPHLPPLSTLKAVRDRRPAGSALRTRLRSMRRIARAADAANAGSEECEELQRAKAKARRIEVGFKASLAVGGLLRERCMQEGCSVGVLLLRALAKQGIRVEADDLKPCRDRKVWPGRRSLGGLNHVVVHAMLPPYVVEQIEAITRIAGVSRKTIFLRALAAYGVTDHADA
jgi:hypothetical protein